MKEEITSGKGRGDGNYKRCQLGKKNQTTRGESGALRTTSCEKANEELHLPCTRRVHPRKEKQRKAAADSWKIAVISLSGAQLARAGRRTVKKPNTEKAN